MSAITQQKRRRHTKTLAGILVCLAVWFVLYHSLAGGTLLAHNVYDSYALQAKNWLNGSVSIAGGERYTWLELATYHGKYYLSFPPVPAVLQLPWVMALGENTPSNLITAIYALFAAAGVYFVLAKSGKSPQTCACWTLLATLGSNFTVITASGGVWLQAQILNLCFAVWGLYFYLADQKCAAFALLALAVGCRPFSVVLAAILFLPEIRACAKSGKRGQLLKMAALPLLIAALLCGYNYVRFGNPLEFGHNYLPEFLNSPKGQFSLSYLPTNLLRLLRPVTLSPNLQLQFPLFDGFLFFLANPIFAVWFVLIAKCAVRRRMGGWSYAAILGFCAGLIALCLHKTLGGWQFGVRYTVDLIPYVLLFLCGIRAESRARPWMWTVCGCAMLFNIYGTLYINLFAQTS